MKQAHRPDLFMWSRFDETRNLDFHSVAWIRPGAKVLIDPLPMSAHDIAHLRSFGGASTIVITNSDHTRDAQRLAELLQATVCAPQAERERFALDCERWIGEGDEIAPGLRALELEGSKTPGELALVLEETTLIAGDLIRAHAGGQLSLLPDAKLNDKPRALASIARVVRDFPRIEAVLVGDGWPVFREGHARLRELLLALVG